jgi:hypothetical protein
MTMPTLINIFSLLAALGFTVLAVYPVQAYLRRGWAIKKTDIFSSFSEDAKVLYLKVFMKTGFAAGDAACIQQQAAASFEKLYLDRYGRYKFRTPLLLFTVVNFIGMFLVSQSALAWVEALAGCGLVSFCAKVGGAPMMLIPDVAAAAISGAYVWIVSDLISRNRRLDLSPTDVLNATLRLSISAALATAVVSTVKDQAGASIGGPLAFALGAFPLDTVATMLRRFAEDKVGLKPDADSQSTDTILNLDSVDHPTADRLRGADISTIAQLAYADPVQLAMRTGLGFDFVLDLVGQALAWIYLGDRLDDLRSAGLRGAVEIHNFLYELSDVGKPAATLAVALLKVAPGLPQDTTTPPVKRSMETAQFLKACDEIANDPYTKVLVQFWKEADGVSTDVIPDYAKLFPA